MAIIKLSAMSCLTSRTRPEPKDNRIAISRARERPRPGIKFMTFALAIMRITSINPNTAATIPPKTGEKSRRDCISVRTVARRPSLEAGYVFFESCRQCGNVGVRCLRGDAAPQSGFDVEAVFPRLSAAVFEHVIAHAQYFRSHHDWNVERRPDEEIHTRE